MDSLLIRHMPQKIASEWLISTKFLFRKVITIGKSRQDCCISWSRHLNTYLFLLWWI